MQKTTILVSLMLVIHLTFAQKLTYNDLLKFAEQSTDQSAELLFSKGFKLAWANDNYFDVISFRSFLFKSVNEENIGVDFHKFKNGKEEIRGCFSQKFDTDFKKLEAQIKINTKKIRFFFSSELNRYVTEYKIRDKYLYITRGLCSSVKTNYEYGNFLIVNKKYE